MRWFFSSYWLKIDDGKFWKCEVATSKLARKTHIDMLNKVQINYYAAGLHRVGSEAVFRYTNLELGDRYELLKLAFGL